MDSDREAYALLQREDFRAAHRILRRLVRRTVPGSAEDYVVLCHYAYVLERLGFYARSLSVLDTIQSRHHRDDDWLPYARAQALTGLGKRIDADEVLSGHLTIHPEDQSAESLRTWNRIYDIPLLTEKEMNLVDGAEFEWSKTLRWKAIHYSRSFRWRKAKKLLAPYESQTLTDFDIAVAFAEVAGFRRQFAMATKYMLRASSIRPGDPSVISLAGRLLSKQRCSSAALRWFHRLLVIPGRECGARRSIAFELVRQKRFDEAEWHVRRMEVLEPDSPYTKSTRARMICARNGLLAGLRYYIRAIKPVIKDDLELVKKLDKKSG